MKFVSLILAAVVSAPTRVATAQRPERARTLGIPLEGTPGPLDAITDVAGVEVGHTTLIEGNGPLVVGKGPVRTGVTVVHPRGKPMHRPDECSWPASNHPQPQPPLFPVF